MTASVENLANACVMQAEAKYLRGLTRKMEAKPSRDLIDRVVAEKQRLDPDKHFDHEEYWRVTGKYTKGELK